MSPNSLRCKDKVLDGYIGYLSTEELGRLEVQPYF
jgi:hypothetical protein